MDIIIKIEKLFKQAADNSVTAEEAKSFSEKAEELLIKYSIDRAMLNLADDATPDKIVMIKRTISNPYRMDKILLMSAISKAFRCKLVYRKDTVSVVGYESDLENVEFLYANLFLQATGELLMAELEGFPGGNRTSYRKSFFLGFTNAVGERLSKFTKQAVEETTGAEVVLYDRALAVEMEFADLFPNTHSSHINRSGYAGYNSGTAAGRNADIGISRVGNRGAKAIG